MDLERKRLPTLNLTPQENFYKDIFPKLPDTIKDSLVGNFMKMIPAPKAEVGKEVDLNYSIEGIPVSTFEMIDNSQYGGLQEIYDELFSGFTDENRDQWNDMFMNLSVFLSAFSKEVSGPKGVLSTGKNLEAINTNACSQGIEEFSYQDFINMMAFYTCNPHAKAVWRRFAVAERVVGDIIRNDFKPGEEVEFVSLASGAGRMASAIAAANPNIDLTLVDMNEEVLQSAVDLAKQQGLDEDRINTILGNVMKIDELLKGKSKHLLEALGLLDYFITRKKKSEILGSEDDPKKIRKIQSLPTVEDVIEAIYESLDEGGILVTSNMQPNNDIDFVYEAVKWPKMWLKRQEQMVEILRGIGFEVTKIYLTPTNGPETANDDCIYPIYVAKKPKKTE